MANKIYDLISTILAPPALAMYVAIIFSVFLSIDLAKVDRIVTVFIGILFLGVIPILFHLFLYKKKYIESIDTTDRKSRHLLYVIFLSSYFIGALIFWALNSNFMFTFSLASFFVILACAIINLFFKISVHVAGVTVMVTALVYVFGFMLLPMYSLVLIISYARLKKKVHKIEEVLTGFIVALLVTYIVYLMMW